MVKRILFIPAVILWCCVFLLVGLYSILHFVIKGTDFLSPWADKSITWLYFEVFGFEVD